LERGPKPPALSSQTIISLNGVGEGGGGGVAWKGIEGGGGFFWERFQRGIKKRLGNEKERKRRYWGALHEQCAKTYPEFWDLEEKT